MSTFVNRELSDMLTATKSYADELQLALYEQFKLATILSQTQNFRGETADALKTYINSVSIHFINRILDLAGELKETGNTIAESFLNTEPAVRGILNDDTIVDIVPNGLTAKNNRFEDLISVLESINARAQVHVALVPLHEENVRSDFSILQTRQNEIYTFMQNSNTTAHASVDSFIVKLDQLRSDLQQFLSEFSTESGIDFARVPITNLNDQEWFNPADANVLIEMWANDPFVYVRGHGAVWENQWVSGNPDVFATIGIGVLTGQAHFSLQDGVLSMGASRSAVTASGEFETRFVSGQVDVNVAHAEVSATFGWNEDYFGMNLSAAAAVLSAEGSMTFGEGALSATLSSEVNVLSADAHAICEFEGPHDFTLSFGAGARTANGTVGLGFVEVPATNGGTVNLFGASVQGEIGGVGGGAGIYSTNVWSSESNIVGINSTTVRFELSFIAGVEVQITLPTISFNPFGWLWP